MSDLFRVVPAAQAPQLQADARRQFEFLWAAIREDPIPHDLCDHWWPYTARESSRAS